jgi:hypothetical protein
MLPRILNPKTSLQILYINTNNLTIITESGENTDVVIYKVVERMQEFYCSSNNLMKHQHILTSPGQYYICINNKTEHYVCVTYEATTKDK